MDIMNRLLPFTKLPDCFNKYAFRLCISVFVISVIFGGESVLPICLSTDDSVRIGVHSKELNQGEAEIVLEIEFTFFFVELD